MNKKFVFYGIYILLIVHGMVFSQSPELYNSYGNFSENYLDPNTGLTVFPVAEIPSGGKYEGMGTAFTAVAEGTGCLEANPAGSSQCTVNTASLSHHAWIADSNIETLAAVWRLGHLGLGASLKAVYLPYTDYDPWGLEESRGCYSESLGTFNISYNFFETSGFSGLALGMNLKTAYRHIPSGIEGSSDLIGGMADFGLLTRFNFLKFYYSEVNNFSLGVALKNLGLTSSGEPLPLTLSGGLSYAFIKPLLLSMDFNLPLSLDSQTCPAKRWNLDFGADINITHFLSCQAGFQLKENPRISLGTTIETDRVDVGVNYNLDLSSRISPLDKFSIQATFKLGDSHPVPPAPSPRKPEPTPQVAANQPEMPPQVPDNSAELNRLLEELRNAGEGESVVVKGILFDDQDNVTQESRECLDSIALVMKEREDISLSLSTYAPFSGDPDRDYEKFIQRTLNLQETLEEYQIPQKRLIINPSGQIETETSKDVVLMVMAYDPPEKFPGVPEKKETVEEETGWMRKVSFKSLETAENGEILTFHGIVFEQGQDMLFEDSRFNLSRVAEILKIRENISIALSAYSESMGNISEEFNLSVKRAMEMKKQLVLMGVPENRVLINPSSEVVSGDVTANARVVFKVIDNNQGS